MPELPEVEAARRGIQQQFAGRRLTAVDLRLPKLVVAPSGLTFEALVGDELRSASRHGKYLSLDLGDSVAVVHLKLSGQIVGRGSAIPGFTAGHPVPAFGAELPHKSTHLVLTFDDDAQLFLTDIRHFARVVLLPQEQHPSHMSALRLGPDALSEAFTREWLHAELPRRGQARLKPLLLDQSFIAGLGNIYVDESLHLARQHPERRAGALAPEEVDALYDAIVRVLEIAVPTGGAEILNGRACPEHGLFPFAHGREGLPCVVCGTPLVKERVDNRGTYRCPECQPPPDDRSRPA